MLKKATDKQTLQKAEHGGYICTIPCLIFKININHHINYLNKYDFTQKNRWFCGSYKDLDDSMSDNLKALRPADQITRNWLKKNWVRYALDQTWFSGWLYDGNFFSLFQIEWVSTVKFHINVFQPVSATRFQHDANIRQYDNPVEPNWKGFRFRCSWCITQNKKYTLIWLLSCSASCLSWSNSLIPNLFSISFFRQCFSGFPLFMISLSVLYKCIDKMTVHCAAAFVMRNDCYCNCFGSNTNKV